MELVAQGGTRGEEGAEDVVVAAEGALQGRFVGGEGCRGSLVAGEVARVHGGEGGERVRAGGGEVEHFGVGGVDGGLDEGAVGGGGGDGGGGVGGGGHGGGGGGGGVMVAVGFGGLVSVLEFSWAWVELSGTVTGGGL